MSDNQREDGHYRLYTYPEKPIETKLESERYQRVAFIGSNDLRGQIHAKEILVPNRFQEKRIIRVGGVSAIKTYKDILEKHYKEQAVFLDSGSFFHESENHNYTIFLRNYLGYDIGNLGPQDFKLIPTNNSTFKKDINSYLSKSNFNTISSNLFDLKKAKQIEWAGVKTGHIVKKSGLKIGFIGIITPDSAKGIPDRQINGLYFQNATKRIITKARDLRRKGAQVLVLMINGEIDCTSQLSHQESISEDKVNFQPFESYHCDTNTSSFSKIINQLPPKTIDIIFSNGINSKVANYIKDYPVVQTKGQGQYLSWVELVFDKKHNSIDQKQTKIYQPVQLCHNFIKKSQDCFTQEDISESEIISAQFLGEKIIIKPLPKI